MASDFGFHASESSFFYFVSYNTEDVDRVAEICQLLNAKGLPIWYDNGLPRDSFGESVIAEKIDKAQESIFFITRGIFEKARSRNRNEVFPFKEYDLAKRYKKKALIVILDEISDKDDVPYSLMAWWQEIDPKVRQGILAVNMSAAVIADAICKELGYDPSKVFSINDDIRFPTFNSCTDHPQFGDETQFVRIRKHGESEWLRSIGVSANKQYHIDVFFRNDANPQYNTSDYDHCGVAFRTAMYVDFPEYVNSKGGSIFVKIKADNMTKDVSDSVAIIVEGKDALRIRYVPGSAIIYNGWKANEQVLPSSLFSFRRGALLGMNELNGVIPGGDRYTGHVQFVLETKDTSSSSWPSEKASISADT